MNLRRGRIPSLFFVLRTHSFWSNPSVSFLRHSLARLGSPSAGLCAVTHLGMKTKKGVTLRTKTCEYEWGGDQKSVETSRDSNMRMASHDMMCFAAFRCFSLQSCTCAKNLSNLQRYLQMCHEMCVGTRFAKIPHVFTCCSPVLAYSPDLGEEGSAFFHDFQSLGGSCCFQVSMHPPQKERS